MHHSRLSHYLGQSGWIATVTIVRPLHSPSRHVRDHRPHIGYHPQAPSSRTRPQTIPTSIWRPPVTTIRYPTKQWHSQVSVLLVEGLLAVGPLGHVGRRARVDERHLDLRVVFRRLPTHAERRAPHQIVSLVISCPDVSHPREPREVAPSLTVAMVAVLRRDDPATHQSTGAEMPRGGSGERSTEP